MKYYMAFFILKTNLMKEQQQKAIEYLKTLDIEGCITGSCLLDYFEGSDIDVFCYSEASFTKLLYTLHFNPLFTTLDKIEQWKFKDWTESSYKGSLKKLGLITIKMYFNTCIPVNIIFKEKNHTAFDVLQSFDMDIICKAYDIKTKQILDLTNGSTETKIASFNKWNSTFYSPSLWAVSRVLRQFGRTIKYYRRSYNTNPMVLKYIELLKGMLEYENIFTSSEKMDEKMLSIKTNAPILIKILQQWLETHEISDTELELIEKTIKNL